MAFPSALTHEKTLQTICTCFFYSFSLEFVVSQHSNKQMTRHSTMASPPSLRRKQCRFAVWSHWASQPAEAFWLCIEHRICMNKKNIYTSRHLLKKHHKKECKPPAHCERGPAGHWPFAHANIPVFQHHQDKHIVHQETMNGAAVIWKNDPWLPTMAEMKSQAQHDDCVHVLHLREEQTAMSTSIDYDSERQGVLEVHIQTSTKKLEAQSTKQAQAANHCKENSTLFSWKWRSTMSSNASLAMVLQ